MGILTRGKRRAGSREPDGGRRGSLISEKGVSGTACADRGKKNGIEEGGVAARSIGGRSLGKGEDSPHSRKGGGRIPRQLNEVSERGWNSSLDVCEEEVPDRKGDTRRRLRGGGGVGGGGEKGDVSCRKGWNSEKRRQLLVSRGKRGRKGSAPSAIGKTSSFERESGVSTRKEGGKPRGKGAVVAGGLLEKRPTGWGDGSLIGGKDLLEREGVWLWGQENHEHA